MQERFIAPEEIQITPNYEAGELSAEIELVLSSKQRLAIIERDGGKCQATVPHEHNYNHPLEVDHLVPRRYGYLMGLNDDTLDRPENLLSKCVNGHDLRHKDRIKAREHYRESGGISFGEMFKERGELLAHGEIYWDDTYDRTDIVRALQLTQKAKEKGWVYPEKRRRKA